MRLAAWLVLLLALLVTGCVTHGLLTPLPPVAADDAAEIMVARERRFLGGGATVPITLNGVEVYGLNVGEHVVRKVPPGDHIIGTKFRMAFGWEDVTVMVRAEPRRTYYFRIDPGPSAPRVNAIAPETGRELVSKTTRISQ